MSLAPALPSPRPGLRLQVTAVQNASLWLFVFLGFVAIIEPSPYEIMFIITALVFAVTGVRVSRVFVPLMTTALLFNLGGAFALIPFLNDRDAVVFIAISFYMGVKAVLFACIMLDDTENRLKIIRHAWITAAFIAAACGLLGYFNVAGLADIFTRYGRASGTFKDPNVMGPFVGAPAVLLIQAFFTGEVRRPVRALIVLFVLLGGVFFSFSRGAWGATVFSALLSGVVLVIASRSTRILSRVVFTAIAGVVLLGVALTLILSIESVRSLFLERFSLTQSYDVGAEGRFGKVGAAITLLLERPNGLGPLHFEDHFPEAPHNVYLNSFSSYGWLGGFAYFSLVACTLWIGWSAISRKTPWQPIYIAFCSITLFQILQGVQIDTDHWRHFWLLIGITWGTATASRAYTDAMQPVMPRPTAAAASPADPAAPAPGGPGR